ncbi:spore coat protein [Neobacillus notoginsengisoli]|uniref:spore coat protein n=1 Tax=Neobacillus notoginsengisoli TaxID=1578198 RepID=UPI001F01A7C5|nr:spore coat protein [Neobacillus notoginsengisoli]
MALGTGKGKQDQEARQRSETSQVSDEIIVIRNSADVTVHSTDTKAALSLQAALQAAIQVVIRLSIADSDKAEKITQELLNSARINQITRQRTIVENSRGVKVTTTDTQIAVNIQVLIQLLLALIVELDIF